MLVSGSDFTPYKMELFHLPYVAWIQRLGGTAPRWLRFGETTGRQGFPDVQVDVSEPFINSVPDGI